MSTYGLTWETGTAFGLRRDRGELTPVDEGLERDQYELAMNELANAGYEQYEISNFARPGFRCRHNEVYWAGEEYWAFGPEQPRGYLEGRRETNIRSVLGWLNRIEQHQSPVADSETTGTGTSCAPKLIYLGLRRNDGIARIDFLRRSGFNLDDIAGPAISRNVEAHEMAGRHRIVGASDACEGRFVADRVAADFL